MMIMKNVINVRAVAIKSPLRIIVSTLLSVGVASLVLGLIGLGFVGCDAINDIVNDGNGTPSGVIYTCDNGTAKTGTPSGSTNVGACQSCNSGYTLSGSAGADGTTCVKDTTDNTTAKYICANGTAQTGTPSGSSDVEECIACNNGFTLTNKKCVADGDNTTAKYICANGTAQTGTPSGSSDVEECIACNAGFTLTNKKCVADGGDTTKPTFLSAPVIKGGSSTPTGVTITLTASEAATLYWVLYTDGAALPTSGETLIADAANTAKGVQRSALGGVSVTTTPQEVNIGTLSATTTYRFYAALRDAAGNTSAISDRIDIALNCTAGSPGDDAVALIYGDANYVSGKDCVRVVLAETEPFKTDSSLTPPSITLTEASSGGAANSATYYNVAATDASATFGVAVISFKNAFDASDKALKLYLKSPSTAGNNSIQLKLENGEVYGTPTHRETTVLERTFTSDDTWQEVEWSVSAFTFPDGFTAAQIKIITLILSDTDSNPDNGIGTQTLAFDEVRFEDAPPAIAFAQKSYDFDIGQNCMRFYGENNCGVHSTAIADGVEVGTVTATGTASVTDTITYTASGANASEFDIDRASGIISKKSEANNLTASTTYELEITATAGSLTDTATVSITNIGTTLDVPAVGFDYGSSGSKDGAVITHDTITDTGKGAGGSDEYRQINLKDAAATEASVLAIFGNTTIDIAGKTLHAWIKADSTTDGGNNKIKVKFEGDPALKFSNEIEKSFSTGDRWQLVQWPVDDFTPGHEAFSVTAVQKFVFVLSDASIGTPGIGAQVINYDELYFR